jgi:hypothetical protein
MNEKTKKTRSKPVTKETDKAPKVKKTKSDTKPVKQVKPKVTKRKKKQKITDPDILFIEKNKRYIEKVQKLLKLKIQNEYDYLPGKSIRNGWN